MSPDRQQVPVRRVPGHAEEQDQLVVEEPLELVLRYSHKDGNHDSGELVEKTIAITMRTPGHDAVLAAGFFFTEGVIQAAADIIAIDAADNRVVVSLRAELVPDLKLLERHFYTSSSCGVCGKTSLEALRAVAPYALPARGFVISEAALCELPAALLSGQGAFSATGSAHAAALFNSAGKLTAVYEDVGRHNALDKLIGSALLAGELPLYDHGVLLSGRAGFELVQKTRMAASPLLVAIGAPSSLAVDLAWESDMTLVGFLRNTGFNIYACPDRVAKPD
jgi:FdhD protein